MSIAEAIREIEAVIRENEVEIELLEQEKVDILTGRT
jgi:hypothetical protein